MSFDRVRAVADAVLFEGYALYPYRPSSNKNRLRWQFGVLLPRAVSTVGGSDPWCCETQCLVEGPADATVEGKVRFLRLRRRVIEDAKGERVDSLDAFGRLLVSWDEGEVQEIDFSHRLDTDSATISFALEADEQATSIGEGDHDGGARDEGDAIVARVVRTRHAITGVIRLAIERVTDSCARLRVRVENVTEWHRPEASRDEVLPASMLGAHVLLAAQRGAFVSLLDPPDALREAAAACEQTGLYPVLAGETGRRDLVLAAPIILYDHPEVAPESPGDFFDATEIDELLTLRTRTLTDEEKRQARATDARVAALLDRVEAMPEEMLARLHGATRALRWADGEPVRAVRIGGVPVAIGTRVRLRPGSRRTDAQDMFLAGMIATVRAVKQDVDGHDCLGVTVDEDPAAELHAERRRYHYFRLDEVEPLAEGQAAAGDEP